MAGVLNISGLEARLDGRTVLRGIDLACEGKSGWLGVVGANGSGKTTLLRVLAGRLAPSSGGIAMAGERVEHAPARRAALCGFAPPLESLPAALTARELLGLTARSRKAHADPAPALFAALEIDCLRNRRVGAMSSGQRQRVAIATAFIGEPPIVLLDEPFNWLDPVCAYEVRQALAALACSTLVVTALHDAATLALWCSEGLVLAQGAVVQRFDAAMLAMGRADLPAFEQRLYLALKMARGGDDAA